MQPPGRGDRRDYARYLAGMDASMRQKVALTAAHLLSEGRVADMGMGSGAGSHALAALYPALEVVGVDLDPEMVALARETHALPNLSFVVGDIAERCFEDGTLDGIFDSSVLHHVTSFGGYRHERAADALRAQVAALRTGGVLVVRDFLHPGPGEALLDLPETDGDASADPRTCSTAALFERCAREHRSLHPEPGFPYRREDGAPAGHRRYRCALVHAVELVLRKDYRADWEAEIREEYTYFTQDEFERTFAALGLRVLASTPIRNPWIVRNRFRGRFVLSRPDGTPHEDPATNYVIVGEKVAAGEGVRFEDRGDHPPLGYLELSVWEDRRDGRLRDLVRRPNRTVDVVPWFEAAPGGDVFVLARTSYPRPLAACSLATPSIDGARSPVWMAEPLIVVQGDKPLGQTVEEALQAEARVAPERVRSMRAGSTYYPSPGGTQEEVASVLVEIDPLFVEDRLPPRPPLSSGGRLRAIEARQLLRAAQVGGMPDARLEINAYDLLARLGRDRGPWIGEAIVLRENDAPPPDRTSIAALEARPPRRAFRRAEPARSPGFLALRCRRFAELDASGAELATLPLELVLPASRSASSIVVAPLWSSGGTVWIGLDDDDLPAVQCFRGTSEILTAPAWRLPREVATISAARALALSRLRDEHGVVGGEVFELGGRYLPSAGLSPEAVHPLAVEVRARRDAPRALRWVPLEDAAASAAALADGHLRVVVLRAAHALGLGTVDGSTR